MDYSEIIGRVEKVKADNLAIGRESVVTIDGELCVLVHPDNLDALDEILGYLSAISSS